MKTTLVPIIKNKTGDTSDCHTGDQTADHILPDCPTFTNPRTQIWPDGISLHQQLHGTTEDLRRTVGFIQQTGLSV